MSRRIKFLSVPIDALTMEETLQEVERAIAEQRQLHHTVVNAGKMVMMSKDAKLFQSVVEADLINADGQGVVWAARLLGQRLPERVAGIDLMNNLIVRAHQKGYKAFFFGAREEVVQKVVRRVSEQYSPAVVAGYRNGYYEAGEAPAIARQIAESGAQMLFVAISSPAKENFLHDYKHILNKVNFIMGVGGSFDVVAGVTRRAPRSWQVIGLEWLYRFLQEPSRMWRRYTVGNIEFAGLVLKEWYRRRKS
jgi:N-acetylglucosaminyldiphosphoundecaprenol N-acetyl-beta-D-mannosaminyltransferase